MDRLRLLKRINADGCSEHLNEDELRLLLYMIANCTAHGEGELLGNDIRRIFGRDLTMDVLDSLCTKLERLHGTQVPYRLSSLATHDNLVVTYRIVMVE